MGHRTGLLLLGSAATIAVGTAIALAAMRDDPLAERPRSRVPPRLVHVDHAPLIDGPFPDGPSVTRRCLECHPGAAKEVMATAHWTWLSDTVAREGREPVRIGKKNLLNNFCIALESNWPRCTSCHAGYGWSDATFDFAKEENVDCLVCHEQTGTYVKAAAGAGHPAEGIDLAAVARSVAAPSRASCGYCHFQGGGGDAVKHGDLDGTMYFPTERIDVHMGRHDLSCRDCHRTEGHSIQGRSMSVSVSDRDRVSCTDCHSEAPHRSERLNGHARALACQTCHIPFMAVEAPTKMSWDWSTAGQDRPIADPHVYDKKKGTFTFAKSIAPEYRWYNGLSARYLKGDPIDPEKVVDLNYPKGDIREPKAKIWPFKVHRGKQPYDRKHGHLLVVKTFGKGGYWSEFDWAKAARLGAEASGLPFSGEIGFAETAMYWPLSHMVATKDRSLQCTDCHGEGGRMDWKALGYEGDPALRGGRARLGLLLGEAEGEAR